MLTRLAWIPISIVHTPIPPGGKLSMLKFLEESSSAPILLLHKWGLRSWPPCNMRVQRMLSCSRPGLKNVFCPVFLKMQLLSWIMPLFIAKSNSMSWLNVTNTGLSFFRHTLRNSILLKSFGLGSNVLFLLFPLSSLPWMTQFPTLFKFANYILSWADSQPRSSLRCLTKSVTR